MVTQPSSQTAKDGPRANFIGRIQEQRQFRVALAGLLDHHRHWRKLADRLGARFNPDHAPGDESYTRIFLLHGIGGIGKSWLTRRCLTIAQETEHDPPVLTLYDDVSVGAAVLEPADLLDRLSHQLVEAGYKSILAPYRRAQGEIARIANRVTRYRLENQELWEAMVEVATRLATSTETTDADPASGQSSSKKPGPDRPIGDAAILDKANDLLLERMQQEGQLTTAEVQRVRQPAAAQAVHLVAGLKEIVRERPLILALDNLEIVVPLESFIRDSLVLPTIHLPIFWILSGRHNLADERVVQIGGQRQVHKGYRDLLGENPPLVWDMSAFGDADLHEYLEAEAKRRHIPLNIDTNLIGAVKATSSGVPLVVEMVADALFTLDRAEFLENFIIDDKSLLPTHRLEQITGRFLRYCLTREDDMERVQGLAMLRKGAEEQAIRAVWDLPPQHDVAEMLQEMRMRYAFVQTEGLHDAVYEFVRRQLQTVNKQDPTRERLSRRAAAYYRDRWTEAHETAVDPALRTRAATWQAVTRDRLNALLWADSDEAVDFFVPRFVEGLGFDRPLADELLLQIEQFLEDDVETVSPSEAELLSALRAGLEDIGWMIDEPGPAVGRMVRLLLDWPGLEALHISILYLWQGGWLVGEARYDDALTAYLRAEEQLPARAADLQIQLGKAFYRLSGRFLWPERSSETTASEAGLQAARKASNLDPENGDAWYNLGLALEALDRVDEAIPAIQLAIDLEPRPAHYNSLGEAYARLDRFEEAIAAYQQALKLDPGYAWPYHGLGLVASEQREYEQAITYYRQALERHHYDAERAVTWDGLGDVYATLERYDKAIDAYQQGIKLNPDDALLWYSLGNAFSQQAHAEAIYEEPDYRRAIDAYRRAIELDPAHAWSYHKLGLIYEQRDEYEQAITFFQQALERHQDDAARAVSWNNLGEIYTALDRDEEAMAAYQQALELDPDYAPAWNRLGEALSAQGRYAEALEAIQRSIDLDPDKALPWYNLGNASAALKHYEQAIKAYQQALAFDPDKAWSYNNLGFVYQTLGNHEKAITLYQEAIERHQDGHSKAISWDNLGNCYQVLNDLDEAISAYRWASVLDSDYPWPYHNLGLVYSQQGKYEQAVALLQQAIERQPAAEQQALSWHELGAAYQALNRSEAAIAAYQRAIELNPRYALAWYKLGNIYRTLDRDAEVIEAYQRAIELDPDYAWPYHHLALIYAERGAYELAITHLQQAIERHEADEARAVAWTRLGDIYHTLAQLDEASGAYRQAIELDPAYPWPYHNLGLIYSQHGEAGRIAAHETALEFFQMAIERHAEAPDRALAWNKLGDTYRLLDQPAEAIMAYEQAIDLDPESTVSWNDLGDVYLALDRLEEATEAYQQAIEADPDYAWPYHNLGLIAGRRGEYEAAVEFFEQATERHETDADRALAWDKMGDAYRALERAEAAIAAYQQAIELNPDDVQPKYNLGRVYHSLGRLDEAIAAFQQAIDLDPENARPWNGLGDAYQAEGRTDEAEAAYQMAIELDPAYALPYHSLGRLYEAANKQEQALNFYQRAIERHAQADRQAVAWSDLGDVYSALDRDEKAIEAYQQAIELDPSYAWPYHNLGLIYEKLENYGVAANRYQQALERHEVDEDRVLSGYRLGTVFQALNRPEAAVEAYQQLLELEPNHVRAWNSLGTAYTALERYETAIAAFERAMELEPDNAWPYHNLGYVHEKQAAHQEAITFYEQAIERHQADQDSAVSWNNLGNNYRALEQYEEAIKVYRRAIELAPEYAPPWDSLGDTYRLQDRDDEAEAAYQKAITLDPGYAWPYHNLGLVYRDQNKPAAAIPLFQQAIERHQNDHDRAVSWNNLGNAYSALSRSEEAIEAHRRAIELDPDYAWPYNNLGFVYAQSDEHEQAVSLYRQAIERHKSDDNRAVSWDNLGKSLAALDRFEEAQEAYQQAIELDTRNALPWYSLGNLYRRQEKYESAIEAYQQAIELEADYTLAWNRLGDVYRALDQPLEAIEAYQQAIELDPDDARAYRHLAAIFEQQGEYEQTIIHYQQAINRYDSPAEQAVLWNKVGDAYQALEEPERAINAYGQAAELDRDFTKPWDNLGHLLMELGRYQAAANAFQQTIALAPNEAWAYHYLGRVQEKMEAYEAAASSYRQAIKRHETDADRAVSWYSQGNAYSNAYQYDQAIEAYQQAIQLDPTYALPWSGLGDLYSNLRHYEQAIEAYRQAIEVDPTHAPSYNNLGFVQEQLGHYEAAKAIYQQVIEQLESPRDQAVAWNNLGNVHRALAQPEEAIAAYRRAIALDPNYTWPYHNLGAIYEQRGDTEQALALYQQATGRRRVKV